MISKCYLLKCDLIFQNRKKSQNELNLIKLKCNHHLLHLFVITEIQMIYYIIKRKK